MPKSCFDGYLTDECAKCEYWNKWANGEPCCGCGCPFPISECEAFSRMEAEENRKNF